MHFGRVLRAAGMPVGTDRIQLALQALQVGGLTSRRDFHAALSACLVDRAEHRALFDQAFHIFWRDPDLLGRVLAMLLPRVQAKHDAAPTRENRRLGEALFPAQSETRDDAATEGHRHRGRAHLVGSRAAAPRRLRDDER